jgi:hypothetical protein
MLFDMFLHFKINKEIFAKTTSSLVWLSLNQAASFIIYLEIFNNKPHIILLTNNIIRDIVLLKK